MLSYCVLIIATFIVSLPKRVVFESCRYRRHKCQKEAKQYFRVKLWINTFELYFIWFCQNSLTIFWSTKTTTTYPGSPTLARSSWTITKSPKQRSVLKDPNWAKTVFASKKSEWHPWSCLSLDDLIIRDYIFTILDIGNHWNNFRINKCK